MEVLGWQVDEPSNRKKRKSINGNDRKKPNGSR